jgi:hypothetical protein
MASDSFPEPDSHIEKQVNITGDVSAQIGFGDGVVQTQSGPVPDSGQSTITVLFWQRIRLTPSHCVLTKKCGLSTSV